MLMKQHLDIHCMYVIRDLSSNILLMHSAKTVNIVNLTIFYHEFICTPPPPKTKQQKNYNIGSKMIAYLAFHFVICHA